MLTSEDRQMIEHFWREKGDLSRWSSFQEKWPAIKRELPQLAKAWQEYVSSRLIMDIVVRDVAANAED